MPRFFQPSFKNLDKDVEKYLVSQGKAKELTNGTIEFRGYYATQEFLFGVYLENKAYDPLISNLQTWNWEVGDNTFLAELADRLMDLKDWPRIKKLWGSVLTKRRKLYNQKTDIMRKDPGAIPFSNFHGTKELLLAAIKRLITMAEKCVVSDEVAIYTTMVERVGKGLKA